MVNTPILGNFTSVTWWWLQWTRFQAASSAIRWYNYM